MSLHLVPTRRHLKAHSTCRNIPISLSRSTHQSSRRSLTTSHHNPPSRPQPTSPTNGSHHENLPSFNLFHLLRDSKPSVRYTVYLGLGLMATAESTFWFNVIKAKYFPSADDEENEKGEQLLEIVVEGIQGYRARYLGNYWRYYGSYIWGAGER